MPWRRSALLLGVVALSAAACGRDAAPLPATVPAPKEVAQLIPTPAHLVESSGEVAAVHRICQAAQLGSRVREALDCYDSVFERWGALGRKRDQGILRLDSGALYISLGDHDRALAALREALPLLREDREARAAVLTQLGNAYFQMGVSHRALSQFQAALALTRRPAGLAAALNGMGLALQQTGRLSEALLPFRQALALYVRQGNRSSQAAVWTNVGWLHLDQDQTLPAQEAFQKGLELSAATGHREAQIAALAGMARTERRKGNPIAARDRIERALAVIESVRADTGDPKGRGLSHDLLKATYFATQQDHYAFLIGLLQEVGDHARALQVNERARARSLSDALGSDLPAALSPREIQETVLDDDTALLEYSLGEEKSFLWWVTRTEIRSFELPGREELEANARRLHRLLARRPRPGSQVAARRLAENLSETLVGPVAGHLAAKRLLIVAPDALQVVPFETLPLPGAPDTLIDRHVVVRAPSASVLARLRAQRLGRAQPDLFLTLVGDPVTSAADDRLPAGVVDPRPGQAMSRLPYADDEIRSILDATRGAEVSVAAGFDAVPEAITGTGPIRSSIVHLVAHGLLDERSAGDSAILLSRFDSRGRPREGRLRAGEIRGLDLEADLVVLSACETALGREMRGEGLVGLTHGFLSAGASAVVVSLWEVDDRATAELMERFYREMIQGRPPDEALRAAQLSLRRESRWKLPYFWGGFVLVGDWLNNPPSGVSP